MNQHPAHHKGRRFLAFLLAGLLFFLPFGEEAQAYRLDRTLAKRPRYDLTDGGTARLTRIFEKELGPGLILTRFTRVDKKGRPTMGAILEADLTNENVSLDYLYNGKVNRRRPLSRMADEKANLAGAINGDFFDMRTSGTPNGNSQDETREVLNAWSHRTRDSLVIDGQGGVHMGETQLKGSVTIADQSYMINSVNMNAASKGTFAVYTDKWGNYARLSENEEGMEAFLDKNFQVIKVQEVSREAIPQGQVVIASPGGSSMEALKALQVGDQVNITYRLSSELTSDPQLVMANGHRILTGGKISIQDRQVHPRTAVGTNAEGNKLFMVVVDGRSRRSGGMTMVQLARLMRDIGSSDAVNFDGGGSTTMVVREPGAAKTRVINRPSDGSQRSVANGLGVLLKEFAAPEKNFFNDIHVGRITGEDRIETACKVATLSIKKADKVILARSDLFADALSAGPLAHQEGAAILLVNRDRLDPMVKSTIKKIGAKDIILAGGDSALSDQLAREAAALDKDGKVERIGGSNRYETSALMARRVVALSGAKEAVVATGLNFADALSVAPFAGAKGAPILLTAPNALPASTASAIKSLGITGVHIIGGDAAVSSTVQTRLPKTLSRIGGSTRYETAALVAKTLGAGDTAFVASGENFADAMVIGPVAAAQGAPILLTTKDSLPAAISNYIQTTQITNFLMIGGKAAIGEKVEWALWD